MTWLSEIEARLSEINAKYGDAPLRRQYNHVVVERMARVIRELAKGTSLLQEAVAKEMTDGIVLIVAGEFLDNLSPDAKELLK